MSQNQIFTKKDTNIAKGIAVLLMLLHHLFSITFGTICISMFLFLSGYGIYHVSRTKSVKRCSLTHLRDFWFHYLFIFFLFIPMGFFFFHKTFEWKEFILNLLCFECTYNREWWFVPLYMELLLFSPLFIWVIEKKALLGGALSVILCGTGLFLRFIIKEPSPLLIHAGQFLNWQLLFVIGYFAGKYKWYEGISHRLIKYKWNRWYIYGAFLLFTVVLREGLPFPGKVKDPFLTPLFLYFCVALAKAWRLHNVFGFLGKHAMNMWLVHTFFCYYYVPALVYFPRFVPFIFIWLVLLSLGTSCGIDLIKNWLRKGYHLCRTKKISP